MHFSEDNNLKVREFQQKGFITVSGLFPSEEADLLLSLIRSTRESLPRSSLNRSLLRFYSNVYKQNESIQQIVSSQKVLDILTPIAGPDLWIRWDQAVMKEPGGEEFPWHQDNGYNRLRVEHYQLWIALSDMKEEDGGLWLLPGSHLRGIKKHKNVAHHQITTVNDAGAVKVEANKGDAVLFSSLLLHKTSQNVTTRNRWAYVVEYMSQQDFDPFVKPPYFLVSENGLSHPQWVETYPGSRNSANIMKYLDLLLQEKYKATANRLKSGIRKIFRG
ncbi:MAG: phytanoyl-CoA dioxygenase family protein [Bacteroidia bacterium]